MIIDVNNLGKHYNQKFVFRNLSFSFRSGNVYAILGPNGSGKSTLIKILSGALSASEGSVTFLQEQQQIEADAVYRQVAIAAPYLSLIEDFTILENIRFHRKLKPFVHDMDHDAVSDILEFDLRKEKKLKEYSSGQKQRVKVALAVLSDVPIVLLDEPASNLDLVSVEWYKKLVADHAGNKLLIVASNSEREYDFATESINMLHYKKREKGSV